MCLKGVGRFGEEASTVGWFLAVHVQSLRGLVIALVQILPGSVNSCITQLKAHGPSRTCSESKEEEEKTFGQLQRVDPPPIPLFGP